MRPCLNTMSKALSGLLLTAATLLPAGPSYAADGKSARAGDDHDGAKPKKVDARPAVEGGGGDLAGRVEALERRHKELAGLLKQLLATAGKQADQRGPDAKPGRKEEGGKHAPAERPRKEFGRDAEGDRDRATGRVPLVKGKDGQLLVPLSALPPAVQKELLARAKGEDQGQGREQAGAAKKGGADGDERPRNKEKGGGDDDGRGRKVQKEGEAK